jgi:ABC-2 type transport system permease protein
MAVKQGRHVVARLFRLWRLHATMDLLWMTRDVRTVATFLASDAIVGVAAVTATFLLAERFHGIGRWTTFQVVFLLGYAMLVAAIPDVLFNYNIAYISRRLGRGQLDHTLIQPQPVWMALLTEGFMPFSTAAELIPGLAVLIWAMGRTGVALSPAWLALLALNLVASAAIALAFSFTWGCLAFWAPRAAEEINSSSWRLLDQLKPFPLDGVGPALLGGLLTVIPVGFLAWYPCRVLLGLDRAPYGIAVTPLAAVIFAAIALWVFRRGMQQYGRTGSQRYLSFGHRR